MRYRELETQQAIFNSIIEHKLMICDLRFFTPVARFIKTSRKKKNEAANVTLG
jgi:hypothetical protein